MFLGVSLSREGCFAGEPALTLNKEEIVRKSSRPVGIPQFYILIFH